MDSKFKFPPERPESPERPEIFGIDVSHHNEKNCQCRIDWNRVAVQKVAFVYVKASEAGKVKDPHFSRHWPALGKVQKIHRGAYHFMSADDSPEEQAKNFLDSIGTLGPNDLPPALDLEEDTYVRQTRKWAKRDGDYWSDVKPDVILNNVRTWLKIVQEKTGRKPVIYTNREWWNKRIGVEKRIEEFEDYGLWLSSWAQVDQRKEQPNFNRKRGGKWDDWVLWQFTAMGDLESADIRNPSAGERLDVSMYKGTLVAFREDMGIGTSVPRVEPPQPPQPPSEPPVPPRVADNPDLPKPPPSEPPVSPRVMENSDSPKPPPNEPPVLPRVTEVPDPPKPPPSEPPVPPRVAEIPDPPKPPPSEPPKLPRIAKILGPLKPPVSDPENGSKIPTSAQFPKNMIEVELKNGRVVRADANIDPEVLARLVSVAEQP